MKEQEARFKTINEETEKKRREAEQRAREAKEAEYMKAREAIRADRRRRQVEEDLANAESSKRKLERQAMETEMKFKKELHKEKGKRENAERLSKIILKEPRKCEIALMNKINNYLESPDKDGLSLLNDIRQICVDYSRWEKEKAIFFRLKSTFLGGLNDEIKKKLNSKIKERLQDLFVAEVKQFTLADSLINEPLTQDTLIVSLGLLSGLTGHN